MSGSLISQGNSTPEWLRGTIVFSYCMLYLQISDLHFKEKKAISINLIGRVNGSNVKNEKDEKCVEIYQA